MDTHKEENDDDDDDDEQEKKRGEAGVRIWVARGVFGRKRKEFIFSTPGNVALDSSTPLSTLLYSLVACKLYNLEK